MVCASDGNPAPPVSMSLIELGRTGVQVMHWQMYGYRGGAGFLPPSVPRIYSGTLSGSHDGIHYGIYSMPPFFLTIDLAFSASFVQHPELASSASSRTFAGVPGGTSF